MTIFSNSAVLAIALWDKQTRREQHDMTLNQVADAVIRSIEGSLTPESIQKLSVLFPDTLLLASLDIIDRECVVKYTTPINRRYYQVFGSTATYTVFLLPGPTSAYCTCPAFAYAVLMAESHLMCKHVLATRLAEQLGKCVQRTMSADELAAVIARENLP